MKVLVDVWRRTSKRTQKVEYIGAYKTYHSCGSSSEIALITKGSFDNFMKSRKRKSRKEENELAGEKTVALSR